MDGVQVNTVLPALQAEVVGSELKGGVDSKKSAEVRLGSIASLKTITTGAVTETPEAKFAGTVETMVGCASAVTDNEASEMSMAKVGARHRSGTH